MNDCMGKVIINQLSKHGMFDLDLGYVRGSVCFLAMKLLHSQMNGSINTRTSSEVNIISRANTSILLHIIAS